ncbi:MAG: oligosaccharide flippase family protein [Flavobacteriales bacterium]|nr:oligosaccharide flippase family protein [Flavobacteriales bacterium]
MSGGTPSLTKQGTAVFIGQFIGFVINFCTPIIVVRLISVSDYGVLQQFLLLGNTLIPILMFGLGASLYYFYPVNVDKMLDSYVLNTYLLTALSGLLFVLASLFFGDSILEWFGMQALIEHNLLIAFYILFLLVGGLMEILTVLEKRLRLTMIFNPIDKVVRMTLLVSAAFLDQSVSSCLMALLVYSGVRFVLVTGYIFSRYRNRVTLRDSLMNMKTQLIYSTPFAIAIVCTTLSERFDKFVVNKYIDSAEFAVYSLAFYSIPVLGQAFNSINNVVIPKMSSLLEENRLDEVLELFKKVVLKTSSLALPAITFFMIMAPEIIVFLFTDKYENAVPYYRFFMLTILIVMTGFGNVLRAAKKTRQIMVASFIGMLVTVAFGSLIIPRMGMNGAIITSVIGVTLPGVLQLYLVAKCLNSSLAEFLPWKSIGLAFVASLIPTLLIIPFKIFDLPLFLTLSISAALYFPMAVILEYWFKIFAFQENVSKIFSRLTSR